MSNITKRYNNKIRQLQLSYADETAAINVLRTQRDDRLTMTKQQSESAYQTGMFCDLMHYWKQKLPEHRWNLPPPIPDREQCQALTYINVARDEPSLATGPNAKYHAVAIEMCNRLSLAPADEYLDIVISQIDLIVTCIGRVARRDWPEGLGLALSASNTHPINILQPAFPIIDHYVQEWAPKSTPTGYTSRSGTRYSAGPQHSSPVPSESGQSQSRQYANSYHRNYQAPSGAGIRTEQKSRSR